MLKLYLIMQSENTGYDTYDSAVVVAKNEEIARNTYPGTGNQIDWTEEPYCWCSRPENVEVRYLGDAVNLNPGVICASFNAG